MGLSEQYSLFTEEEASLLQIFEYYCRAKNLAEPTIKSYLESVQILARYAKFYDKNIKEVSKSDIQQLLLSKLNNGWSGGTANHRLRNWSVFFNFLIAEGIINHNPAKVCI